MRRFSRRLLVADLWPVQPAADDALLYGFCIPAGLGSRLWLLAQLGQAPLRGAIVPVVAAKLWHLGVLVGLAGILSGNSTGFAWLEFPRAGSVILFFAYLLLALWAMMNFAARHERALYPSHWFLVAALFWFPWIYSTANLVPGCLAGARRSCNSPSTRGSPITCCSSGSRLSASARRFISLPKFSGRPLPKAITSRCSRSARWFFSGLGAAFRRARPLPAWMPVLSSVAATLTVVPVLAVGVIAWANFARWKRHLIA